MPTVFITAPRDVAADLAEALVEERLAACVNLVDCHSVFRWEGDVVTDEESILLAKTTPSSADDLMAYVEDAHPYEVPCIERFDAEDVHLPFGEWVRDSVGPAED